MKNILFLVLLSSLLSSCSMWWRKKPQHKVPEYINLKGVSFNAKDVLEGDHTKPLWYNDVYSWIRKYGNKKDSKNFYFLGKASNLKELESNNRKSCEENSSLDVRNTIEKEVGLYLVERMGQDLDDETMIKVENQLKSYMDNNLNKYLVIHRSFYQKLKTKEIDNNENSQEENINKVNFKLNCGVLAKVKETEFRSLIEDAIESIVDSDKDYSRKPQSVEKGIKSIEKEDFSLKFIEFLSKRGYN